MLQMLANITPQKPRKRIDKVVTTASFDGSKEVSMQPEFSLQPDALIDRLYNEIFQLRIKRDHALGINTEFVEINGKKYLLRDASNVNTELSKEKFNLITEHYNYRIIALNYLMVLQRLNVQYNLEFTPEKLLRLKQARSNFRLLSYWNCSHISKKK